jgi:Family of unknown function (DUF6134)
MERRNDCDARMIGRRGLLISGAALVVTSHAKAELPSPPGRELVYKVMRHGSQIGQHAVTFSRTADGFDVHVVADASMKLGPIPLFRYEHRYTESWRGGEIVSLDGETNRNGTRLVTTGRRTAAGLEVRGTGTPTYIAPPDALPTTYWNKRLLQVAMIGSQDGGLVRPKVTPKGVAPIPLATGATIPAKGYKLTGDLDLDLWYDESDGWASMSFTAAEGSLISYERV